ncbi:MAG: toll/interleukin-1 receptor domain-containing protein [Deltaproteobacteria bacterium]|jgi:hypothetical protein|nr:toll/interleukin-1 receptor domain-containing protein [Deltaproteobacteria bacterium]
MSYEFYAFISYERGEADEKWARRVQTKLESYRIPVADLLVRSRKDPEDETAFPKRMKVFRDKSDLGTRSKESDGLFENLDVSRFLVVICSKRSANSPYVDAETRRFVETGRQDHIIPLVIDSSSADQASFPPSLPAGLEPVFAAGDHEETFIHLLARLLRVDRDNLRQARLRASRSRAGGWLALVAAVLLMTTGLAAWAVSAEKRATERRIESEKLVEFLTFEMVNEYSDWLLSKNLVDVTDRVQDYFERWEARSPRARLVQAVNLSQRSNVAATIDGRTSDGLSLASEALRLLEGLRADQPDDEDIFFEYSHALLRLAVFSNNDDDTVKADFYYRQNISLLRAYAEKFPDSLRAKGNLALNITHLAELAAASAPFEQNPQRKEKYVEESEALFREGEELWNEMFRHWPQEMGGVLWRFEHAQFWSSRSVSALHRNDFRAALTYAAESFALYEKLYAEDPQNLKFRVCFAFETSLVALIATKLKLFELADSFVQLGDQLLQELMAEDPQIVYALSWAYLLATNSFLRIEQGRLDEAEDLLNRAEEIADRLIRDYPERPAHWSTKALIEEYRELARQNRLSEGQDENNAK